MQCVLLPLTAKVSFACANLAQAFLCVLVIILLLNREKSLLYRQKHLIILLLLTWSKTP